MALRQGGGQFRSLAHEQVWGGSGTGRADQPGASTRCRRLSATWTTTLPTATPATPPAIGSPSTYTRCSPMPTTRTSGRGDRGPDARGPGRVGAGTQGLRGVDRVARPVTPRLCREPRERREPHTGRGREERSPIRSPPGRFVHVVHHVHSLAPGSPTPRVRHPVTVRRFVLVLDTE